MVKLKQMRLVNCQSWRDGIIDFSEGLNVIRAQNNTGKSVIFKALRITSNPSGYDKEDRIMFIRRHAEYAEITYLFSDDSASIVRVFPNKTLYYYTPDAHNTPLHGQEDEPHEQLLEKLSLIIDRENGYVANILDDEQPMLLVRSSDKSNYNLVKLLTEHPQLNRLIGVFKEKYIEFRGDLSSIRSSKQRLEYKLNNTRYVDEEKLEYEINTSESFLEVFDYLINILKLSTEIKSNIVSDAPWEDLYEVGNVLSKTDAIIDSIDLNTNYVDNELIELSNFFSSIDLNLQAELPIEIEKGFVQIDNMLNTVNGLKKVPKEISLSSIDGLENISNIITTSCNLYNTINRQEKILKTIEELESIDFEGEEYECPLHGRIKYTEGRCHPL